MLSVGPRAGGSRCPVCLWLPQVMAPRPFLAFWPGVVVAAELGGIGPGLLATVASILCVQLILNPHQGWLTLTNWVGMTAGGIFFIGAVAISIFIGKKRKILSLQQLQSSAMQAASNGIVLTDTQGDIFWVNRACCTMTGYSPEELIGKNFRLLAGGEQNESV